MFLAAMMMLLVVATMSCKKEVNANKQTAEQTVERTNYNYAPTDDTTYVGHLAMDTLSGVIDYSSKGGNEGDRGIVKPTNLQTFNVKPIQRLPIILQNLSRDREHFTEYWDVNHYIDCRQRANQAYPLLPSGEGEYAVNPEEVEVFILEPNPNNEAIILRGWTYLVVSANKRTHELEHLYVVSYESLDTSASNLNELVEIIYEKKRTRSVLYNVRYLSYDFEDTFLYGDIDYYHNRFNPAQESKDSDGNVAYCQTGYMNFTTGEWHQTDWGIFYTLRHRRDWNDCEFAWRLAQDLIGLGIDLAGIMAAAETFGVSIAMTFVLDELTAEICGKQIQNCNHRDLLLLTPIECKNDEYYEYYCDD